MTLDGSISTNAQCSSLQICVLSNVSRWDIQQLTRCSSWGGATCADLCNLQSPANAPPPPPPPPTPRPAQLFHSKLKTFQYELFCILMTTVVQLKLASVQYGLMSCQPINCISSKICKVGEALDWADSCFHFECWSFTEEAQKVKLKLNLTELK